MSKSENFKVYGCNISDFLIGKAINKGINKEWLKVCDATNMDCYKDNSFDYSYSIGSLEHFTDKGILKFVDEVIVLQKSSLIIWYLYQGMELMMDGLLQIKAIIIILKNGGWKSLSQNIKMCIALILVGKMKFQLVSGLFVQKPNILINI